MFMHSVRTRHAMSHDTSRPFEEVLVSAAMGHPADESDVSRLRAVR